MNNLARNIGIWYSSKEWAEKLFKEICENVPGKAFFKMNENHMEFSSCTNIQVHLVQSRIP